MELRKKARVDYASSDSSVEPLTARPTGVIYEKKYIYKGCSFSVLVADSRIPDAGKGLYLATSTKAFGDGVSDWMICSYRGDTVEDRNIIIKDSVYDNEYRLAYTFK
jgi:hypothetical protein